MKTLLKNKIVIISIVLISLLAFFYAKSKKLVDKWKQSTQLMEDQIIQLAGLVFPNADKSQLMNISQGALRNNFAYKSDSERAQILEGQTIPDSIINKVLSFSSDDASTLGTYSERAIEWYKKNSKESNILIKYLF